MCHYGVTTRPASGSTSTDHRRVPSGKVDQLKLAARAVAGGRPAVTIDGQVRNRLAKSRGMKVLDTDEALASIGSGRRDATVVDGHAGLDAVIGAHHRVRRSEPRTGGMPSANARSPPTGCIRRPSCRGTAGQLSVPAIAAAVHPEDTPSADGTAPGLMGRPDRQDGTVSGTVGRHLLPMGRSTGFKCRCPRRAHRAPRRLGRGPRSAAREHRLPRRPRAGRRALVDGIPQGIFRPPEHCDGRGNRLSDMMLSKLLKDLTRRSRNQSRLANKFSSFCRRFHE